MKKITLILSIALLLFGTACSRSLFQNEDESPANESDKTNPPHIPQGFRVDNGDDSLLFAWDANSDGDISGYQLLYSKVDENLESESIIYSNFVDVGNVTSYELYDLENDNQYYFTLRAVDLDGNASGFSTELIETPIDTRGPDAPSEFKLTEVVQGTPSGNENVSPAVLVDFIRLTWTNPSNRDFQGVQLIRKAHKIPSSQNDGEVVASGNISFFEDLSVTAGLKYYYRLYAYDEIPNFSTQAPVRAGIIILPTEVSVLTTISH
ncbi:fibronectin type III domain-containing protein [bacterium]|nr:fibronectin type III domain-containing protein [bacterium]